jgi:LuxR family maltose regulon positive regulatory protein
VVSRSRLIERLNAGLWQDDGRESSGFARKLTLVSASAGFGKTTLVSEWIRKIACPAAWLSLDRGDNDPLRFWQYIIVALQTVDENRLRSKPWRRH